MKKEQKQQNTTKPMAYDALLAAGFTVNKTIDIVERLIAATEDDCLQYGCDAETDEDVIGGRKLLEALKACRMDIENKIVETLKSWEKDNGHYFNSILEDDYENIAHEIVKLFERGIYQ